MAQGSRQIQSQAQQQVQTLSPQQILVVKLLELPAVELEDRIHAELLEIRHSKKEEKNPQRTNIPMLKVLKMAWIMHPPTMIL